MSSLSRRGVTEWMGRWQDPYVPIREWVDNMVDRQCT